MKVSKNSKYQTHKKSIKLTKNPNDGNGAHFQHPLLQNIKKLKGGPFGEKNFPKKVLQCRKKLKGGPFGIFQHSSCHKTSKIEGGTFWFKKNFRKKVSQCRTKKN